VGFSLRTAFSLCREHTVSWSVCALLPVHKATSVLWVLLCCSQPCTLCLAPQSSVSTTHWSVLPLLFDPTASPFSLSLLSGTLTRLVLVQYHLQFGAGVLFRHILRNITALSCCGISILFVMLHSLAHKTLRCRFSYRNCYYHRSLLWQCSNHSEIVFFYS